MSHQNGKPLKQRSHSVGEILKGAPGEEARTLVALDAMEERSMFAELFAVFWLVAGILLSVAGVFWIYRSEALERLEKHAEIALKRD